MTPELSIRMVLALERIANALELMTPLDMPTDSAETTCPHPLEHRTDFGMTNGQPDWQCRLCQHKSLP